MKALITGITGMVGSHLCDFYWKIQIGMSMEYVDGEAR